MTAFSTPMHCCDACGLAPGDTRYWERNHRCDEILKLVGRGDLAKEALALLEEQGAEALKAALNKELESRPIVN